MNFLDDRNIFYSNEANLGGLLDSFTMKADHQKDLAMMQSLELSAHPPRRGEGLEIELITDHAYMMKPPQKSLKYRVQGASMLVNIFSCQECSTPNSMESEAPALGILPDLTYVTLPSGCSSVFIVYFII